MKRLIITLCLVIVWTSPISADEYYLAQWVWNDSTPGYPYWEAPHSEFQIGGLDFRNNFQKARFGGVPEGWALFVYDRTISDPNMIYLGNDVRASVPNRVKNRIRNSLNVNEQVSGTSLLDILWDLLMSKSDPTGQTRWKPLMPGVDGRIKLYLGSQKIRDLALIPFISPEWDKVLAVIHEDYRRNLQTEKPVTVAKWLDYMEHKYGVPYDVFIPKDSEIRIASIPHNTTITEDFNCADSDSLTCDLTWTSDMDGDHDISSNRAKCDSANSGCISRADSDLSTDDHYAQVIASQVDSSRARGTMVRKDSSATLTFYGCEHANSSGGNSDKRIVELTGGSYSVLDSVRDSDPAGSDTVKCEVDGSNITMYLNGTSKVGPFSDGSISGNLRTGLMDYNSVYTSDDFEAADLAASTTRRVFMITKERD